MILLPLYVHPLEDPAAWEAVAAAGPDAGVTVVVNVHNGPGDRPEEAYTSATARLAAAGVPMLGYVDLGYGSRVSGEVWCDLTGWARYPVAGVFFDQAPSAFSRIGEVGRLTREARGLAVLNPGTRPHAGYSAIADLVCTFEGPWDNYLAAAAEMDWPNAAHLVYGVPAARLAEAEELRRARAPHGLVTDLAAPQPYRGLPARLRPAASPGPRPVPADAAPPSAPVDRAAPR